MEWSGELEKRRDLNKFWNIGGTFLKVSTTVNDTTEVLLQILCSPQHSYPDSLETEESLGLFLHWAY